MKKEHIAAANELLTYVRDGQKKVKTTPITELFPAIFEASQVMGVREISRWLKEKKKISISPSTISRALRFPDPHWKGYSAIIEDHVRTIVGYSPFDPSRLFGDLASGEFEVHMVLCRDRIWNRAGSEDVVRIQACEAAAEFLDKAWFIYDAKTRERCRPYLAGYIEDYEHEQQSH